MTDPSQWTPEIAEAMAVEEGIAPLNEQAAGRSSTGCARKRRAAASSRPCGRSASARAWTPRRCTNSSPRARPRRSPAAPAIQSPRAASSAGWAGGGEVTPRHPSVTLIFRNKRQNSDLTQYSLNRRTNMSEDRKLAIICSKGSLDMAYPGLVLANAARMMGIEADLFFTFWGMDIITKDKVDHLKVVAGRQPGHAHAAVRRRPARHDRHGHDHDEEGNRQAGHAAGARIPGDDSRRRLWHLRLPHGRRHDAPANAKTWSTKSTTSSAPWNSWNAPRAPSFCSSNSHYASLLYTVAKAGVPLWAPAFARPAQDDWTPLVRGMDAWTGDMSEAFLCYYAPGAVNA